MRACARRNRGSSPVPPERVMASWLERSKAIGGRIRGQRPPKDIYMDLRSMALTVDLSTLQTPAGEPWTGAGLAMMEMGMERAVASIVAIADGTVSMYLSTGGGLIGAGEHEAVRAEAKRFRSVVADSRSLLFARHGLPASRAWRGPLPGADRRRWLQRCGNGVRAAWWSSSAIAVVRGGPGSADRDPPREQFRRRLTGSGSSSAVRRLAALGPSQGEACRPQRCSRTR